IAEIVLGKAPDTSRPFPGDLAPFAGTYSGHGRGRPTTLRVTVEKNQLRLTNTAAPAGSGDLLKYYGNDTFGVGDNLVTFEKENGKVTKLRFDTGGGYNILSRQAGSQR